MRKTFLSLFLYLCFTFFFVASLWALGDSEDNVVSSFVPDKNYRVQILDNKGVSIKAEKVSMNKLLHLEGMLGELKILIPFAKISTLKSFRKQNKKLFLDVQLVGGKKLKLEVAKDTLVAGTVSYGSFQVYLMDLSEVVFLR